VNNLGVALTWPAIQHYYPREKPGSFIMPVPEHDLIYVKNPKAACSTLVVWLDRIHTGDLDSELRQIHKEHRLPTLREVGRSKVIEMLAGGAYRFSFVRNPLRRFESAYWDKLVRSGRYRLNAAAELGLPMDPDTIVSFEEFLGAVERQDPVSEMDPHWRPQHVNLLHPVITYDHVGRLESFDVDLERIREEAGLPHVPVEAKNVSRNSKRSDSAYDGRPDLVRRVAQLYAKDFELYGY
jgi:hypothetical protein